MELSIVVVKFELINMASHFVNDFLTIECIMYNDEEPITKIIYDNINIHTEMVKTDLITVQTQ
jgi:hypothetical protein